MSGPGKFPRVETNQAAGSTPGGALPSIPLSFSLIYNRIQFYRIVYNYIQSYTIVYKCIQFYTTVYNCMQLYTIVYNCINSIQLIIYNFECPAGISKLYYFEFLARDSKFLNSRPGIQNNINLNNSIYNQLCTINTVVYNRIQLHTIVYCCIGLLIYNFEFPAGNSKILNPLRGIHNNINFNNIIYNQLCTTNTIVYI